MRGKRHLDDIDLEIVRLLVEDARRPFSDIAEHVGLSPPAVSDRIDRLQEQAVIRRFTVDIDRSKLQNRTPLIVELQVIPTQTDEVYQSVCALNGIEHVFKTYDGTVIAHGNAPTGDLNDWLYSVIDMTHVSNLDITLVDQYTWSIDLDAAEFALSCAVCGNTVRSDGTTAEIGGNTKAFCCPSCKKAYLNQYETHRPSTG